MNTLKKKTENNKEHKYPRMTKHYIERYFTRILNGEAPKKINKYVKKTIYKDMDTRMLDREKTTLKLFSKTSNAIVPIGRYHNMVVSKNTLITVY
jgi:hypothetical protein|tara:strand:- start:2523 stop:2807 length:285 start_codon:yes stop_codon:yes gene_type:complete